MDEQLDRKQQKRDRAMSNPGVHQKIDLIRDERSDSEERVKANAKFIEEN